MFKLEKLLAEFERTLPHFRDGRINYSKSDRAAVVSVFVRFKEQILLLKRSGNVREYKGKWHTVAGYMDEGGSRLSEDVIARPRSLCSGQAPAEAIPWKNALTTGLLRSARNDMIVNKVLEELREEIGVGEGLISDLKIGDCYEFVDSKLGKTWYVNPVLVDLKKKPRVKINREHTDFVWLDKADFSAYECVPSLFESWQRLMK